ncbi:MULTISPECIES: GNAT family N-acetyltransferase [Priestia]|uniref:GNAT family N-acetyltransferase n=1 Tax=Priestia TaxID=2800373 RepID=UPI0007C436DB|nr:MULTISPECIES: GNAT family protein [Priestia]MBZ5478843.1 GNAT family N-acetyltransferase [Bacillus sp. T_4]MDP9574417.1 ribosomal-protein-alanine N-acetyltransferase [Bacillus sp. 1751]MBD8110538.1 GNAT family N-acetyltransferase [Priestia megaterium]MBU8588612.1 GNAT family N-acetyltransferase [Priestia megaterium]MCI4621114.1 GNAT family N-acetyltransferase [Priestia megaterium]
MSNYFPIIKTKRLILREIVAEDAGNILKYLSDKEVMKHYGLEPFTTVEDASNEIAWYKSILNEKSGIRWGITLEEQDDIIGSCGFLNRVHNHCRAEIGYELSKDYWGNGIANAASQKLIKKNGFIKEGLLRSYEFTCGKFDDLYMYSLLKQDFDRLQPHEGNI